MDGMTCLTVQPPWADAIFECGKRVENRVWPTKHRGPLLIHSGKSREWLDAYDSFAGSLPPIDSLVFGAIIGVVNVVDCMTIAQVRMSRHNSPFAFGPHCLILEDVRRFATPLRYSGQQRLFTVPMSEALQAALDGVGFQTPLKDGGAIACTHTKPG